MAPITAITYDFPLTFNSNYGSVLHRISKNTATLKSGKPFQILRAHQVRSCYCSVVYR